MRDQLNRYKYTFENIINHYTIFINLFEFTNPIILDISFAGKI